MLKGFKDFITRGNVVDLAVGIVIGAAFTALVSQFTTSFLEPLINLVGAGDDSKGGSFNLIAKDNPVAWGSFLNAVIAFLLTAAVIYFLVVLPMNKLAERRKRGLEPESDAPSEEVRLLTEIRDALTSNGGVPARTGDPDRVGAPDRAAGDDSAPVNPPR